MTEQPTIIPDGELIPLIFDRQRELAVGYMDIQTAKGHKALSPDRWGDLDAFDVQMHFRENLWWFTEELSEAVEHRKNLRLGHWRRHIAQHEPTQQFFEELADALHFLTEASLNVGMPVTIAHRSHAFWRRNCLSGAGGASLGVQEIAGLCGEAIFEAGLAANCLKNKPWKRVVPEVDRGIFFRRMETAWYAFGEVWHHLGCDLEDTYTMYFHKNMVNQQRQTGAY